MLPQIVISRNPVITDTFLTDFIQEHKIKSTHIYKITPPKKELSIDQIRLLKKHLIVSRSELQLIILESFQNATFEAQNAFLKTLEEKNEGNAFIMLCETLSGILPTIISRSKVLSLERENIEQTEDYVDVYKLVQSPDMSFLSNQTFTAMDYMKAKKLLQYAILSFKTNAREKPYYAGILKKIIQSYKLLESNNANPQLLIDSLLIYMKKSMIGPG